jgi:predicted dehydrogenase
MRAAIVGLGSIGMRHARNLKTLGVADVIGMDPLPDRRARFTREIGGEVAAVYSEALEHRPDLVVIASPNRFHLGQALDAAEANCHLLIEKPLGCSLEGVDALLRAIETRRLFAHVGSNWKFHAAFRTMKRLLDDGAAGKVASAQVLAGQWLPDWHPWEDYRRGYSARRDLGGGVVFDTHEIDYLTWLLGPVNRIAGFVARSGALEIDTEDVAAACLRFESGALVTLQVDYIQRDYRRSYRIAGDTGTIEWDIRSETVQYYCAGTGKTTLLETPLGDLNEMYLAQTRHVLDGVAGEAEPVTPVTHAARVLALQLQLVS